MMTVSADPKAESWPVLWSCRLIFGPPAVTLLLVTTFCTGSLFWEYVHNPTRHFYEVVVLVLVLSLISFVFASIAQIAAYVVLVAYAMLLIRWKGRVSLVLLLAATPLLGLVCWYGYDYLVPGYRWFLDDRPDFEHGLTTERFLISWAFEALVVISYWWLIRNFRSATATVS